ncbi:MAG: hypothetical protein SF052_22020 [Bacteroidia bacterium]|nr:hypothetical protein [Bacteroidia bacterium]
MMRKILGIVALLGTWGTADAQFFGSKDSTHGRIWNIRFILDGGMIPLSLNLSEAYQGEYYATLYRPDSSIYQEWQWREWHRDSVYSMQDSWPSTVRLGVMVNVVKNLYAGVSYSGHFFRMYNYAGSQRYSRVIPFGTLEGALSYELRIPGASRIRLLPTLYGGTYTSDISNGYEGIGKEWAIGGRIAVGLQLHKKYQHTFRIWASGHQLNYREHEPSFVYENKYRHYESRWQVMNMGFGLLFHIGIREDR